MPRLFPLKRNNSFRNIIFGYLRQTVETWLATCVLELAFIPVSSWGVGHESTLLTCLRRWVLAIFSSDSTNTYWHMGLLLLVSPKKCHVVIPAWKKQPIQHLHTSATSVQCIQTLHVQFISGYFNSDAPGCVFFCHNNNFIPCNITVFPTNNISYRFFDYLNQSINHRDTVMSGSAISALFNKL